MQDKFAASIEKLKEVFVSLVDPLMPVLDVFSSIFSIIGLIMKAINPLLQGFNFLVAAATDLLTVFGSGASGSRIDAAAMKLHESVTSEETLQKEREQSVNDGIAPSSKGPFTITDKFGATAITATGDSLAVSPNIQQTPSIRTPQQATVVQQSQSIDYDKMAQALSKVNVNTNIDGVKVSNQLFNKPAAAMAVRKI
jgi:hypothetical protein